MCRQTPVWVVAVARCPKGVETWLGGWARPTSAALAWREPAWPSVVLTHSRDGGRAHTGHSVAYRPSHADATYDFKYGIRAIAGGGRSSARETIGRVAAGAVAKKILKLVAGCEVLAYVSQVKDVKAENVDHATFTMEQVRATSHPTLPAKLRHTSLPAPHLQPHHVPFCRPLRGREGLIGVRSALHDAEKCFRWP